MRLGMCAVCVSIDFNEDWIIFMQYIKFDEFLMENDEHVYLEKKKLKRGKLKHTLFFDGKLFVEEIEL